MDSKMLGLVLPATLAVTTFVVATSCNRVAEYCVDIEDVQTCNEQGDCAWNEMWNECVNVCSEIEDQGTCEDLDRCEWGVSPGEGETSSEGTDGVDAESCFEPFT